MVSKADLADTLGEQLDRERHDPRGSRSKKKPTAKRSVKLQRSVFLRQEDRRYGPIRLRDDPDPGIVGEPVG